MSCLPFQGHRRTVLPGYLVHGWDHMTSLDERVLSRSDMDVCHIQAESPRSSFPLTQQLSMSKLTDHDEPSCKLTDDGHLAWAKDKFLLC